MTLGELIKQYRTENGLSQRQFALRCGVSNGYISMLEKEVNPKTSDPVMPTMTTLKDIADAMGITLNDLLIRADDMPVNLSVELGLKQSLPDEDAQRLSEFVQLFSQLTDDQQNFIISSMKGLLSSK